ncbi:hypothetical protein DIPPA_30466, partial [Diplonema papillatum]
MNDGDHLVKYYDVFVQKLPEVAENCSRLTIAMDFSSEGDLATHVRSSPALDEAFILRVGIQ